jgi:DNA (cytosine-5)-methyltransferase 1
MPARSPKPSLSNHSVVDVFAGAGGLSEGFRQAGYTILAGSDVDPDAMATFRDNFTDASAIIGDIRQPSIREQVVSAAREATVVVGGPPCQAFSQVRNHSRVIDDPRNSLYREFVLVLGETLPPAFVMENVTGMD